MNLERAKRGSELANAHHAAGKKFGAIDFKHEDETQKHVPVGPVYLYAEGTDTNWMKPFDAPDPDGVFYLGWKSLNDAEKLAKKLGLTLEQF